MTFIFWHLLAICSVMAVAFVIGYNIGSTKEKQNDKRSIN
jgi:hypothetical protein